MGDWKAPEDCKYTKTDEWIRVEGTEGVVGITDYAQDQLSDLVFVEFPEVGDQFAVGKDCGAVESVKASAPIKLPVSGEVIAVNSALEGNEGIINEDPYGKGWLVRIKITNPAELDQLMDAAAYINYVNSRA